jgi:hypothetical protein
VNKVLQFARVKVQTWKIVVPMFVMFISSMVVLAIWTAVETYGWVRLTVDELSGETYGRCGALDDSDSWLWFVAVMLTSGFPVVMALVMAWKTKDVEDSFSESWWIFSLVFVQLQVSLSITDALIVKLTVSSSFNAVLSRHWLLEYLWSLYFEQYRRMAGILAWFF